MADDKIEPPQPPSPHPWDEALQCHLYQPGRACRCPFFQSIRHESTAEEIARGAEPIVYLSGCMGQLFPIIEGRAINAAYAADRTTQALRNELAEARQEVAAQRAEVAELRQAVGFLARYGLPSAPPASPSGVHIHLAPGADLGALPAALVPALPVLPAPPE